MKKRTILSALLLSAIFINHQAKAQTTDSTHYDLGRTLIRKDALQNITIKAADLERMPFSTLSEALNVWLYGVYGTATNYVPVINGIVLTNVDALSIYDIEEITVVQGATANVNGTSPGQVLLLIKTRNIPAGKKWGVRAAGQTDVAMARKFDNLGDQYTTNSYNQYYLSGYVNAKNVSAGVSATYQYDAFPQPKTSTATTFDEPNYHRYKFNAYLNAKLGGSELNFNAGYVPQKSSFGQQFSDPTILQIASLNGRYKNYYANLNFKSSIAQILHNTFTAGYTNYTDDLNQSTMTLSTSNTVSQNEISVHDKFSNYILKDNLLLSLKANDWTFEPSLNLFYHRGHDETSDSYLSIYNGSLQTGSYSSYFTMKGLQVTPSLSIRYRDVFDLQGGAVVLATDAGQPFAGNNPKRIFPYASVMIDLTRMGNNKSAADWRIFGSFASPNGLMQDLYVGAPTSANNTDLILQSVYYSPNGGLINLANFNPYQYLKQWQAGSTLALAGNKVQLNYSFNSMQYLNQVSTVVPVGNGGFTTVYSFPVSTAYLHRLGINANLASKAKFSWRSGINVTYAKNGEVVTATVAAPGSVNTTNQGNDHYVTGGFTNRITAGKWIFGLDALYMLHQPYYNIYTTSRVNSFNLQNVYAGYQFTFGKNTPLEIYANARDAVENKQSTLNVRRLYGVGFKTSF